MDLPPNFYDAKQILLEKIHKRGGWVNAHSHIDRAFIVTADNFNATTSATLQAKWDYPDEWKAKATVQAIYENMVRCIELTLKQGGQALGSFIDCDPIVKDKSLQAAQKVRAEFKDQIELRFMHQPIKGVLDTEARKWFDEAASFVDIIGGLPEKDTPDEAEHLDILFKSAKKYNKMIHIHADQHHSPEQKDTELLVNKTIEYGYQGKVVAVHCISLATQPKEYRQKIYKKLADNDVMVISCPSAWIDAARSETVAPIHNAITPIDEMIPAGITVALGTDGIHDFYSPLVNGDMWTELYLLSQATRFRDLDTLADIASTNGLKVLGLGD
jgi:cytosine/creatinine deaminase